MIAIVDYGVGNLFSLTRSLECLGAHTQVTGDPAVLEAADRIILPGVGAFGDAMAKLRATGLDRAVAARAAAGAALMGICLGMQLLFEESEEYGRHPGLGLIPGTIRPLKGAVPLALKVPHMGWNALEVLRPHPLARGLRPGDCVYYVHSYYATGCAEAVIASSEYGVNVPGIVARGSVCGCQFHPEKSGKVGLNILKAFCDI
ncbi:imidazole glycerol phosphate synthase subunit HisH [Bacillota bacterium Meth-B3]|nr:imidazole glycerol phosphate synthase subunit HisH [Christensenellaceae bacterium]MEA5068276.1 imidazole glycerol phosphate synthase subunit HisH [Christensenellaceae bacterium]